MTTFTTYADGQPQGPSAGPTETIAMNSGGNYAGAPCRTVLTNVFDASRRNLASTDVVELINIPAGTFVEAVIFEIITANAASQTMSVGDGNGTSSWVSAAATDAAAGTKTLGAGAYAIATGTSATNGKFYATADTIDILSDSGKTATTGKFRVSVICSLV